MSDKINPDWDLITAGGVGNFWNAGDGWWVPVGGTARLSTAQILALGPVRRAVVITVPDLPWRNVQVDEDGTVHQGFSGAGQERRKAVAERDRLRDQVRANRADEGWDKAMCDEYIARETADLARKAKAEAVTDARKVISQYLATAEKWRYDRVMWAFAIMLGEIPEDTPEPRSPADDRIAAGGDA